MRNRTKDWNLVLILFIVIVVISFIADNNIKNTNLKNNNLISDTKLLSLEENSTELVKSTINTVVGIAGEVPKSEWYFTNQVEEAWGIGTGVIVGSNGHILTNQHVAGDKENSVIVTLADGRTVDGKTLWSDTGLDLAIIKIEEQNLPTAVLGSINGLQVGQEVIAIGNPLGLEFQRTVTSGIVSALNRTLMVQTTTGQVNMEGLVQTDASINPGNSGGPLINSKGEVIGINAIKLSSAEGLGFAIPIDIAKPIIQKFLTSNSFETSFLGVYAYEKNIALVNDIEIQNGLYMQDVEGPAKDAGIQKGDVITAVNEQNINTVTELKTILYTHNIGDEVDIKLLRNGETKNVKVSLSKKNDEVGLFR